MADSLEAIEYVLQNEGLLEENKNDVGGITKYGISLRFLKSLPLDDLKKYSIYETPSESTIRDLSRMKAIHIYLLEFWPNAPFGQIKSQEVCNFIFDMSVNSGTSPAIKCAQRACWAMMKQYNFIVDDGILGPKTLDLLNFFDDKILPALRSERAGFYNILVAERPALKEFIHGWMGRAYGCIDTRKEIIADC